MLLRSKSSFPGCQILPLKIQIEDSVSSVLGVIDGSNSGTVFLPARHIWMSGQAPAVSRLRGILEMAFLPSHHRHPPTALSGLCGNKNIFIVHVLVILAQHNRLHLNTVHAAFFCIHAHKNIPSQRSVIKCGNSSLMCSTFNLESIDVLQTSRVRGHTSAWQHSSQFWDLKTAVAKSLCHQRQNWMFKFFIWHVHDYSSLRHSKNNHLNWRFSSKVHETQHLCG